MKNEFFSPYDEFRPQGEEFCRRCRNFNPNPLDENGNFYNHCKRGLTKRPRYEKDCPAYEL